MSATISTPPVPPDPPRRAEGEAKFWPKCDAFVQYIADMGIYLAKFITELAAVSAEVLGMRDAAAGSVTAAQVQAQQSAAEAARAMQQADRSSSEADRSRSYAAQAKGLVGSAITGLSTTSMVACLGNHTFTLPAGLAIVPGCRLAICATADPAGVEMRGICLAYDAATGATTVRADTVTGAGTYAAWAARIVPESGATAGTVVQHFLSNS